MFGLNNPNINYLLANKKNPIVITNISERKAGNKTKPNITSLNGQTSQKDK